MLTQVESMNYQPLIRPNHLHGRWAGRGAPPTSLPNPRWGERVDAAEAARLRRRRQECGGGGTTAAEGAARKRLDLIQVTVRGTYSECQFRGPTGYHVTVKMWTPPYAAPLVRVNGQAIDPTATSAVTSSEGSPKGVGKVSKS